MNNLNECRLAVLLLELRYQQHDAHVSLRVSHVSAGEIGENVLYLGINYNCSGK